MEIAGGHLGVGFEQPLEVVDRFEEGTQRLPVVKRRERLAGVLMIFSLAAVRLGVTSVDAVFTAPGTATA